MKMKMKILNLKNFILLFSNVSLYCFETKYDLDVHIFFYSKEYKVTIPVERYRKTIAINEILKFLENYSTLFKDVSDESSYFDIKMLNGKTPKLINYVKCYKYPKFECSEVKKINFNTKEISISSAIEKIYFSLQLEGGNNKSVLEDNNNTIKIKKSRGGHKKKCVG